MCVIHDNTIQIASVKTCRIHCISVSSSHVHLFFKVCYLGRNIASLEGVMLPQNKLSGQTARVCILSLLSGQLCDPGQDTLELFLSL